MQTYAQPGAQSRMTAYVPGLINSKIKTKVKKTKKQKAAHGK